MTTPRVSDATRNDTWDMMLDLERQVRYYLRLADRYMLRYRLPTNKGCHGPAVAGSNPVSRFWVFSMGTNR